MKKRLHVPPVSRGHVMENPVNGPRDCFTLSAVRAIRLQVFPAALAVNGARAFRENVLQSDSHSHTDVIETQIDRLVNRRNALFPMLEKI